jgi:hypothetical protein
MLQEGLRQKKITFDDKSWRSNAFFYVWPLLNMPIANSFAFDLQLLALKVGGQTQFFCLNPSWCTKLRCSKRGQCKKLAFDFQLLVRDPKHVECKFFCARLPSFGIESWRPNINFFASISFGTLKHGSQELLEKLKQVSCLD